MSRIGTDHLARTAFVYIRQSTPEQVRHNLESQRRQYALQSVSERLDGERSSCLTRISAVLSRA